MTGIVEVVKLVTAPGDPVVVVPPVYPPFFAFLGRNLGRDLRVAPLGTDGRLDLDALEEAFVDATRNGSRAAAVLSNPHNPTGALHTADELAAVARIARQTGVRVVADEIHAPWCTRTAAPSRRTSACRAASVASRSSPPRRPGTSPD